jgi:NAD(P)-dependent dehydrogenase (short-subunit alcohol dehydrogenase family)
MSTNTTGNQKVAVITGASSGVGEEAARALSMMGWSIGVVGRDPDRTRAVAEDVGGRPFVVDFDSLDDVRSLASELLDAYGRIDVLANNAGGINSERRETPDGFEETVQRNHLAPFLLTHILTPRLVESGARVITTASAANLAALPRFDAPAAPTRVWLGGWPAYGSSKLYNILFARELARRTGLKSYSFHPGIVRSRFYQRNGLAKATEKLVTPLEVTSAEGAKLLVALATRTSTKPNGSFLTGRGTLGAIHPAALQQSADSRLWNATARALSLG